MYPITYQILLKHNIFFLLVFIELEEYPCVLLGSQGKYPCVLLGSQENPEEFRFWFQLEKGFAHHIYKSNPNIHKTIYSTVEYNHKYHL